jgi:hypothetical protein
MTAIAETEDTVQKTRAWIKSKGRSRVVCIRKTAKATEARLAKARLVDPKSLKKPISR